jgi:Mg2+/citrate symporter
MAEELSMIEAMSVLEVRPGDIVVLKTPIRLTLEQSNRIKEAAEKALGMKVIVLQDGLDIGVLRDSTYIDTRTLQDA